MKAIYAVIFGILSIYAWNYMLIQSAQKGLLFLVYIMVGFLVVSVHYGNKKPNAKKSAELTLITALILSSLEMASASILFSNLLLFAVMDIALKIALTMAGGFLFYLFQKSFESNRKFLFGDLSVLSRRLASLIIDSNILLLIFGAITLTRPFFKLQPIVDQALIIIIIFSYKSVQEAQFGQTPGKKLMGISVRCNPLQACLRNIPIILLFLAPSTSGILLNAIYFVILIDLIMIFTGRRLFDFVSGTSIETVS